VIQKPGPQKIKQILDNMATPPSTLIHEAEATINNHMAIQHLTGVEKSMLINFYRNHPVEIPLMLINACDASSLNFRMFIDGTLAGARVSK
jgi:hypothetical protein